MGRILIGISAWADHELIQTGFYPAEARTSQEKLSFYASRYPIVEMDSSYHFLPSRRILTGWIEATPQDFTFDVKAFSLLTQHPAPLSSVPRDIRLEMDRTQFKRNLYLKNLSEHLVNQIWERFSQTVQPLHQAGKMGIVTFQFPPWFHPSPENYDYLSECRKRLPNYPIAMEFRTGSWLIGEHLEYTLRFLKEQGISLVVVDEPQGLKTSVPAVAEVTKSPGVVRFHGRNVENWEGKGIPANEKYNYLYSQNELEEWIPLIRMMAQKAQEVYVIFKNKHLDYAVNNADQMRILLGGHRFPSF